jgi:hypothetical protein
VPYCGPSAIPTRSGLPGSPSACPIAWIHCPANGSSRSNVSRSERQPFCTPAFLRLSSTVCSYDAPLTSTGAGRSGCATVPCGARLSTVNGPVTRTRLLSS